MCEPNDFSKLQSDNINCKSTSTAQCPHLTAYTAIGLVTVCCECEHQVVMPLVRILLTRCPVMHAVQGTFPSQCSSCCTLLEYICFLAFYNRCVFSCVSESLSSFPLAEIA